MYTFILINNTGVTSGAGTTNPSGTHELTAYFSGNHVVHFKVFLCSVLLIMVFAFFIFYLFAIA